MRNVKTKNDKQLYMHDKLCDFFYSEALAHCTKVLGKCSHKWSLTCEANGLTKRLVLKSKDGCGYLSLFINRTSVKATAVARNRLCESTFWEYLHENRTEIVLADFDKYVPKCTSMKHDFADVLKRMNVLIDCTVAGFDYTGWASLREFPDEEPDTKDLRVLQNNMEEVAHQDTFHYGVHTKKEYDSIVDATNSQN